ncbi:hypothetical protein MASR1M32_05630 [Rhodobacter sp.]
MLIAPFAFAVLYLLAGAFWWRRIVLPGPALGEAEEWHKDLARASARGDVSLLIVKATFILLWPLALGGGWLLSR